MPMPRSPELAGRGRPNVARRVAALLSLALAPLAGLAQPLTLDEAIAVAESRAPSLAAAEAAQRAAGALVTPAEALPDPELLLGLDNVPVTGPDAGSLGADFMTMRRVGVMQSFPRRAKRLARGDRARAELERENLELAIARARVREEVALAWFEAAFAERRIERLDTLAPLLETQVAATDAKVAGGTGLVADGLAARALRVALAERRVLAESEAERARAMLRRWLTDEAARPLASMPDLDALEVDRAALESSGARHRELAAYEARTTLAAADLELARQDKRPDWALEVSYANRGPAYSDMVSVGVRIDLPLFSGRRQDPVIAARRAALEEAEAEQEAARLEHAAELRAQLAVFEGAFARRLHYQRELLPLATDRAAAALAAYRGGRTDLAASLAAMSDLVEAELAAIERDADLARAWAALRYAFVTED